MTFGFDFSVFVSPYFNSTIILYALIVGVLTSLCASVLGVNLVLKRYSMVGDGLSHVGFLALSVAALFGVGDDKTIYITFPVVMAAAILLMWLSESGKLKGDAATALVSVGTVALGYILFSLSKTGASDICSGLFGASILTIKAGDTALCVVLSIVVILLYVLFYNKIFAVTFDEGFAKAAGINTKAFNMLISVFTAVTIVVGMKLIGSIMISAVIVIPAVSAMRIFKSFKSVVLSSAVISVICFILGFVFAVTFVIIDKNGSTIMLPVGATIVCFNILALLVCSAVGRINRTSKVR